MAQAAGLLTHASGTCHRACPWYLGRRSHPKSGMCCFQNPPQSSKKTLCFFLCCRIYKRCSNLGFFFFKFWRGCPIMSVWFYDFWVPKIFHWYKRPLNLHIVYSLCSGGQVSYQGFQLLATSYVTCLVCFISSMQWIHVIFWRIPNGLELLGLYYDWVYKAMRLNYECMLFTCNSITWAISVHFSWLG